MRCSTCPTDRHELCQREGCRSRIAEERTIAGTDDTGPWELKITGKPPASLWAGLCGDTDTALALEVKRLDVEDNDILVLRTAEKLSQEKADAFHDQVLELAQRHGVKGVTVVVLDGCTDLTIERPSTAMAHQRPRAVPQPMG